MGGSGAVSVLRECNEGMSCKEFTVLMVADLPNMPPEVRHRVNLHETACFYHQSSAFRQSALGIYVTPKIEQAAEGIIKKYMGKEEKIGRNYGC